MRSYGVPLHRECVQRMDVEYNSRRRRRRRTRMISGKRVGKVDRPFNMLDIGIG